MTLTRSLILAAFLLMLAGCGSADEDSPSAEAAAAVAADDGASTEPEVSPGADGSEEGDSSGSGEDAASYDGTFTREVAVLHRGPLIRRPEDDLMIRIRHSVKSIIYPIPNGWEPEPQEDGVEWLDQMRIPAPFNKDFGDGFVTVFAGDGEEIYDVINRWLEQVSEPLFTPEIKELEFVDGTPLLVTEFRAVGTYDPGGIEPSPETMMLGAVLEGGPEGTVIFKGVGPQELMETQLHRWDLLLRSVRILPNTSRREP